MLKEYRDLAKDVSTAQVVGLGEALHGSPELHAAITKVARELIIKYGFRTLAIENPTGLTKKLWNDRYTDQNLYKIWRTKEFTQFLKWVKQHNKSNPKDKVRLIGFDIRQPDIDLRDLMSSLSVAHNSALKKMNLYKHIKDWKLLEIKCYEGVVAEELKMRSDLTIIKKVAKDLNKKSKKEMALKRIVCWMKCCIQARSNYGQCLATRDSMMHRQLKSDVKLNQTILIGHSSHLFKITENNQSQQYDFVLRKMLGQLIFEQLGAKYSMIHFTGCRISTYDSQKNQRTRLSPRLDTVESRISRANKSKSVVAADRRKAMAFLGQALKSLDLSDFHFFADKANAKPSSAFAFRARNLTYLDYLVCVRP